jgi:plasmid stability protein
MPVSITIRNVPDETRNELAARAARSGRSLQEYLRAELERLASKPDPETLWARVEDYARLHGAEVTPEMVLRWKEEARP